jgi:hypothetical protein
VLEHRQGGWTAATLVFSVGSTGAEGVAERSTKQTQFGAGAKELRAKAGNQLGIFGAFFQSHEIAVWDVCFHYLFENPLAPAGRFRPQHS